MPWRSEWFNLLIGYSQENESGTFFFALVSFPSLGLWVFFFPLSYTTLQACFTNDEKKSAMRYAHSELPRFLTRLLC